MSVPMHTSFESLSVLSEGKLRKIAQSSKLTKVQADYLVTRGFVDSLLLENPAVPVDIVKPFIASGMSQSLAEAILKNTGIAFSVKKPVLHLWLFDDITRVGPNIELSSIPTWQSLGYQYVLENTVFSAVEFDDLVAELYDFFTQCDSVIPPVKKFLLNSVLRNRAAVDCLQVDGLVDFYSKEDQELFAGTALRDNELARLHTVRVKRYIKREVPSEFKGSVRVLLRSNPGLSINDIKVVVKSYGANKGAGRGFKA